MAGAVLLGGSGRGGLAEPRDDPLARGALAHCKRSYTARIRGEEAGPFTPAGTFAGAVEQLEAIHRNQRDAIGAMSDDDLTRVLTNGVAMDEYLTSTIRHDTWHAAQIAVARRLWRSR